MLDTLATISLAVLWDPPQIEVHRATPRRRVPAPAGASADVSHAELDIAGNGIVAFDETEARLRALHERTRLGAIARQAWGKLFGARAIGEPGSGDGPGSAGGAEQQEPGVFENLAGWVRWHTPLGKGLIAAFGERMQTVEKMLQSGDVDGALKMALKLGKPGAEGKRSLFPARLPGIRSSLDFALGGGLFSMPILGGRTFHTLRQRYETLAQTLERQGDFRRAAYIHAQLLGEHLTAVLTLEKGELYADAARLALDSKQAPPVYIRLFYLAGEHDTALALARRSGCFDALAEDSRAKHPDYHAAVVKAWTDLLLSTGQPLRALQVTDALAATDTVLIARRRDWLRAALDLAGDDPPTDLLVRTLLTADWDALALRGHTDFPALTGTAPPYAAALDRVQALARLDGERAGDDLTALLAGMVRHGDARRIEQAAFWQGPAPIVVDTLVRALLEGASANLEQRDLDTLATLLRKARQEVFATDLAKLRKFYAAPVKPRDDWHLPPPAARSSPVRHACLLHNGHAVSWRESGLLQLLDRHGVPLWQGQVGDVVALVAVGSGANVIVVQRVPGGPDDLRRLTRFASHQRRFHEIGTVRLIAHHDATSDGQWLVQIAGEIGALDLVALCADVPRIEFLWSSRLTERIRAIGFLHLPRSHAWITHTLQPGREHLLEMFVLSDVRDLGARVGRPWTSGSNVHILPPMDWFWNPGSGLYALESFAMPADILPFVVWTEQAEREAMLAMPTRHARTEALDTVQSGDFGRHRVAPSNEERSGETIVSSTALQNKTVFTLRHPADEALRCVARTGPSGDAAARVLLADAHGRLLHVDLARRAVAVW